MIDNITATIYVSNMDRAVEFYTQTLGLPLAGRWGDFYASIDLGNGAAIGLHPVSPKGPAPGSRGAIQVGLRVTKPLDAVIAELQRKGVSFRGPVINDGPVRLAYFGDPDDNDLYLIEVPKWS